MRAAVRNLCSCLPYVAAVSCGKHLLRQFYGALWQTSWRSGAHGVHLHRNAVQRNHELHSLQPLPLLFCARRRAPTHPPQPAVAFTSCPPSPRRPLTAMAAAFAGGLPFSSFFARIEPRTGVPINAVALALVVVCLLQVPILTPNWFQKINVIRPTAPTAGQQPGSCAPRSAVPL